VYQSLGCLRVSLNILPMILVLVLVAGLSFKIVSLSILSLIMVLILETGVSFKIVYFSIVPASNFAISPYDALCLSCFQIQRTGK